MSAQPAAGIHLGDGLGDFMCFTSDALRYHARTNRAEQAGNEPGRDGGSRQKQTRRRARVPNGSRKESSPRKPVSHPASRSR